MANVAEVPSPTLLLYPDRIEENARRMMATAGADRLRPHIKTHKVAEIVRMQLGLGIRKFKCATLAEAEMAARAEAPDVLVAVQPVGPNVSGMVRLIRAFPRTKFSAIADDPRAMERLATACVAAGVELEVLLDVDCGMGRSGVLPGEQAVERYRLLGSLPGLKAGGLHAYDGHIREPNPEKRAAECEAAFAPVEALREELRKSGLAVPAMVAGGTPTFPMHARRTGVECSPGTCVLWDLGYARRFPDLDFLQAALVLARVISKPAAGRLCIDLGHKAIAAENPPPRLQLLELPDARFVMHSEEHLVVEDDGAEAWRVGDVLHAVPWHICPTCALHAEAVVVRGGQAAERWKVVARDRSLRVP